VRNPGRDKPVELRQNTKRLLYAVDHSARQSMKSFVDDLALGRGVVLSRAVTTLRSIET